MRGVRVGAGAVVAFYPAGILTKSPHSAVPPRRRGEGRGEIKGWSAKSRQRLRLWMLTHQPRGEVAEAGVTLTIPGPVPSVPEMRALWHRFCVTARRRGWAFVWRLEVQKRGSPHWHLALSTPRRGTIPRGALCVDLWDAWRDALHAMGKCVHRFKLWTGESGDWECYRDHITGADRRACVVDELDGKPESSRVAWHRYLRDHTSKGKQEQVAQGFGRHWGVVNGSAFEEVGPRAMTIPASAYYRVVRWLNRMCAGTVRDDRAPFGRRVADRYKRGYRGASVWFSSPDTTARMIRHALALEGNGSLAPSDPLARWDGHHGPGRPA